MIFSSRSRPSKPVHALHRAGQGAPRRRLHAQMVQLALAWLLLALVAVPTLGRLHQVAHGSALDRVHAGQAQGGALASSFALAPASASASAPAGTADAARPAAVVHRHGLLLSLLLDHHAPVDCLLLDQLALGDVLHSTPLALPDAVPAHAPPVGPAERTAGWHVALFQARGPPLG